MRDQRRGFVDAVVRVFCEVPVAVDRTVVSMVSDPHLLASRGSGLEYLHYLPALAEQGDKECKVGECSEPDTADLVSC